MPLRVYHLLVLVQDNTKDYIRIGPAKAYINIVNNHQLEHFLHLFMRAYSFELCILYTIQTNKNNISLLLSLNLIISIVYYSN